MVDWTIESYAALNEALRVADEKFHAERDRRLAEVAQERDRALHIKEKADEAALQLAREIQTYKDEKANELREQINRERGMYVTKGDLNALAEKIDAQMSPLRDFVAVSNGRGFGAQDSRSSIAWVVALIASFIAIGSFVFHQQQQPAVYVTNPSNMQQTTPIAPLPAK